MGDRGEDAKLEQIRDVSDESAPSSPDPDGEQIQDAPQVQKRKGGRKPIYATSEERKQRNRQAQAAFRERRTEYIKQLETTIKHHEETLQTLQQSHRTAADECLMLRYKNSLLERILLEKGIDVQAELRVKTGSPSLPPLRTSSSNSTAPPQPVQRVSIGKGHQPRRYITHPPPAKPDTTPQMVPLPDSVLSNPANPSPRSQPTSGPSHFSSPATGPTRSPNFFPQAGGTISPTLGSQPQQRPTQPPLRPNLTPMQPPQRPGLTNSFTPSSVTSSGSPVVPSAGQIATPRATSAPSTKQTFANPFQSHYDQLEEEYDAAVEMADDGDVHSPQGPAPYPQPFQPQGNMQAPPQSMQNNAQLGMRQQPAHSTPNLTPQQAQQQSPFQQPQDSQNGANQYAGINPNLNTFFDPYDPMLDADPFGLSASMHFPTQFSYDAR